MDAVIHVLLFSFLGQTGGFNLFGCSKNVRLLPSDPCLYVTESISMNCSSKGDPRQLQFFVGMETTPYPEEKVAIRDNHTASITIKNAKMSMENYNIVCRDKNDHLCFDSQMLIVYEAPESDVNLTCQVDDWSTSMTCSWHLRNTYYEAPNVTLMWRISGYYCEWNPCPNYNNSSCHWRSSVDGDFSMKSLDVKVSVGPGPRQQCRNKWATTYYKINTKTVVKPSAVDNLESHAINSTCIQLSWDPNRKEYKKIYNISCSSKWNDPQNVWLEDTDTKQMSYAVFCSLVPYTKYSCTVRVKPGRDYWSADGNMYSGCLPSNCSDMENSTCMANTGFWSDVRETSATTYGAAPSAAPAMAEGGYMWYRSDCSNDQKYRNVQVYWKPLSDKDKNGPLRGYDVSIRSDDERNSRHSSSADVTYDSRLLQCDMEYTVLVQARNVNGTSPSSSVTILPVSKGLFPPSFIVEMSNGTDDEGRRQVDVTWSNVTHLQRVKGFTLFTCRNEAGGCAVSVSIKTLACYGIIFESI